MEISSGKKMLNQSVSSDQNSFAGLWFYFDSNIMYA